MIQQVLCSQVKNDPWLDSLIRSNASPALLSILDQPDTFRYQLIYTRIDRDHRNKPAFNYFYLNVDKERYFNPASTVKMPLAFLALEKLRELDRRGLDRDAVMFTDSAYSSQTSVTTDSSSANGLPSIGNYIRKIFLVSDNDAYTRLYEFLGQQYINERLHAKGYTDVRITRRFTPMTEEENRHTNPVRFFRDGKQVYTQPAAFSRFVFDFSRTNLIGRAHFDRNDHLVQEPFDFTRHNNISLEDLQRMHQSVLFPGSVPAYASFHLSGEDRRFLLQAMSELPYESVSPTLDTTEFFPSYTKFFFFRDGKRPIPPGIRVFNKAGWSYGFLTDVAYVVDFATGVEFMVSANLYTNSDGVLNDDKYEYEEVGYAFFREIGEILYQYELGRRKIHLPDLSAFRFKYN